MGFGWFWCPLRGERKLLLEQENLDSVLKSISTWSPASILNLKMWILKMRAPQEKNFWIVEILHFKMGKRRRMNWPFPKKYTPPIGQPPWNQKYFDLRQKPKIPKSPPNLSRGAPYDNPLLEIQKGRKSYYNKHLNEVFIIKHFHEVKVAPT